MNSNERECFWMAQEESLLLGGAAFSEWCTFISKSVYDAFVNGADLATVITSIACIETYFKTETTEDKNKSLAQIIDESDFSEKDKNDLHLLRKYRNSWVHADRIDDKEILLDDTKFILEAEKMAMLSVKMLLKVLFSNPFV